MTADTLLGRTNDPGWLTGTGIIPAYLARQLAITPTALQQALHDSKTGKLLDLGRDHRFALTDLDQHIRAQDLTCTWPGCTRSSDTSQLDHLQPWAQGGSTSDVNLHPPCPRHHRARDAGWQPSRLPDNRGMRWQSPLGITYQTGNGSDTHPGPDDRPEEDDWDPLDPKYQPHAPQRPPPEDPPF